MLGHICLVKLENKKIIPALIIGFNKNGEIIVSQLKPSLNKTQENVVYIGHPEGLKNESVAITYKLYCIKEKSIIKKISEVDISKSKEVIEKYKNYIKIQNLHKELHDLKRKITLAQFNNVDYKELEECKSQVLKELGYEEKHHVSQNRMFDGFRVAPTPGYIKVYKGGR